MKYVCMCCNKLIQEKEELLSRISMLEENLVNADKQYSFREEESKQQMLDYAGKIVSNFTKYFSTEDCMTCLLDTEGKFLIYTKCSNLDLKLTGTTLRKESPVWETLKKGIPSITKIPAGTYGLETPSFVFFAFPIHYKNELIGATGITIDMTNNELLPTLVSGIEEMRGASEELISCVANMKERLDMVVQATSIVTGKSNNLFQSLKDLDLVHETIEDVAERIQLLSLNSKIEASRFSSKKNIQLVQDLLNNLKRIERDSQDNRAINKELKNIISKLEIYYRVMESNSKDALGFSVIADEITKVNDKTVVANKQTEKSTKNIYRNLEEINMAFRMLKQVQEDMYSYNDTLSSMYEELSAQIEQLTVTVNSINIGQEI